ncbi:hypothetical protein OIU78_012899 [Salix suchowensis]|nr:hypothetical protein OIU78_012899 [Salix suchowensis]
MSTKIQTTDAETIMKPRMVRWFVQRSRVRTKPPILFYSKHSNLKSHLQGQWNDEIWEGHCPKLH